MHEQATRHDDGIYFGLPEDQYHSDPALGSSDLKKLRESPPTYWFESPYNPLWEPSKTTPAKMLGTARHKLVLEGVDAFKARYAPRFHNGSTREGKAENDDIARSGKIGLKFDEFSQIMQSGAMIRSNPSIKDAFAGGCGSEVSIFWTAEDGIRRKARIDYWKMNASVDLKNVANEYRRDFRTACRGAISTYRYDMQAAHYARARASAVKLWGDGLVFGDYDRKVVEPCIHDRPVAWVWIFYQTAGAPLTWGTVLSPANPILEAATADIEIAEDNLKAFMDRFGPDTPWIIDEPLSELDMNDLPAWHGRY